MGYSVPRFWEAGPPGCRCSISRISCYSLWVNLFWTI